MKFGWFLGGGFCVPSMVLAFDAINGKVMVWVLEQLAFGWLLVLAFASPLMDVDCGIIEGELSEGD